MSTLAGLTAEVMGEKVAATKRRLTPVAGEALPQPDVHVPDVPGDFLTHEGLEAVEQDLRRHAADLLKVADGIASIVRSGEAPVIEGKGAGAVLTTAAVQKQREFEADLRAKERAAQEATFKAEGDDTESEDPPEVFVGQNEDGEDVYEPAGWVCPDHGKPGIEKTSKSGKTFIGCPDCNKFER